MLKGHASWLTSVSWSPDGSRIATASNDYTARIWDSRSWVELHAADRSVVGSKRAMSESALLVGSTGLDLGFRPVSANCGQVKRRQEPLLKQTNGS